MKALCVRQPWAELIARGQKTVELRTWRTNYRGPLVIVASGRARASALRAHAIVGAALGVTVALVELVDVRPATADDAAAACAPIEGKLFAWVLRGATRLDPCPAPRRLHVYEIDGALLGRGGQLALALGGAP